MSEIDVIRVLGGEPPVEFTRRVSIVQFLRDRELGIRDTNERVVRQCVQIINYDMECWPYHVTYKLYSRLWDECCREIETNERFFRVNSFKSDINDIELPFYSSFMHKLCRRLCNEWSVEVSIEDVCNLIHEIVNKIEQAGIPIYIKIHAGKGVITELVVFNDLYTSPCEKRIVETVPSVRTLFEILSQFEYQDILERNYKGVPHFYWWSIESYRYMLDAVRCCEKCEDAICKCRDL